MPLDKHSKWWHRLDPMSGACIKSTWRTALILSTWNLLKPKAATYNETAGAYDSTLEDWPTYTEFLEQLSEVNETPLHKYVAKFDGKKFDWRKIWGEEK